MQYFDVLRNCITPKWNTTMMAFMFFFPLFQYFQDSIYKIFF